MLVVNLYHLQKSHGLVVHIYGMKMWPGDARTLLYPVKLGAGQFLRPDIQPDIRIKTKIKSVLSHTIPIPLVKFHVYLSITLVVILITDGQIHRYRDTHK